MMIVLASNFLNHHQLPYCQALQKRADRFFFVATTPLAEEQRKLGYADMNAQYDFLVRAYESEEEMERARKLCRESDMLVIGSAPEELIIERLKQKKLTFRYCERFYKNGISAKRWLRDLAAAWLHHGRFQKYPVYLLCASAYTAADALRFGNYRNRCFQFGYFPETRTYDHDLWDAEKNHEIPQILWAGRMIDFKHPGDAVLVAERLKRDGYQFELSLIGTGSMEEQLRQMIEEKDLSDCVKMLGAMASERVRDHMEQANIYLFTSDRGEGWGAVLNESMNSGCAVVASHAIGAVPFLIKDGENGCVYRSGDIDMLYEKVKALLNDRAEQRRLGEAASKTISEVWNAEVAVERLLVLADCIKNGKETPFTDGPCSRAPVLREDWYGE